MNSFEKVVYNRIKKFPFLKSLVRDTYQSAMLLFFPPKSKKESDYPITVLEGYFFGFHDKVPWSFDNSKLLAHRIINHKSVKCVGHIEIGYFNKDLNAFKTLATTSSWNWQQGSMLQWVNNEEIIFNYWDGSYNRAKLIDLEGKVIKELDQPISNVSSCSNFGLSFSFDRLGKGMKGYGYQHSDLKDSLTAFESEDNGISLYDFRSNKFNMLFSVKDIANFKRENSMDGAYHFLTHTQFSPDSKRFLFLHRWQEKGGKRVNTRLLTSDLNGQNLFAFNSSGMVSHLTWFENNKILAYASTKKYGDSYTVFTDKSGAVEVLSSRVFNSDGHPQFCASNNLIVSDTYPNHRRMQQLFLMDIEGEKKKILGHFFSPPRFKEIFRCDLHPRWDRHGSMICFDSVHTGVRSVCIMKLKKNDFKLTS